MKVQMTTSHGDITLELDEANAPNTVANFAEYANSGFYEGTIFHRVIKGFMIQGGGLDEDMNTKATGDNIENEANNGLKNEIGAIAMARTSDPHSATAQFFINTANNGFLDFKRESGDGWGYCVFGKVTDGMDIVTKIEDVDTGNRAGHQDVPTETIKIEKVVVL